MKYAGNLFYAQPFYSILCHLYNCLPPTSLCFFSASVLVSVACPLSRRREQIKWNIFIIYKRFFSVLLAAFVSAVAAPLLLLLFHTFFGNVQINYNALTVSVYCCLPSLSLSLRLLLSVLFLCLRVDFILNKILYASCVWYMLYIRLMYVHGCLCSSFWEDLPWMSAKKPANCRPILRSALFLEREWERGRKPPQIRNNETQLRLATWNES